MKTSIRYISRSLSSTTLPSFHCFLLTSGLIVLPPSSFRGYALHHRPTDVSCYNSQTSSACISKKEEIKEEAKECQEEGQDLHLFPSHVICSSYAHKVARHFFQVMRDYMESPIVTIGSSFGGIRFSN